MLMDFNHLFIKGIGPVMYRLGNKNPAANYTQNKYSKRDGFSVTPDSGIPYHCDMVMKLMEIHQDMGERFKIN